MPQGQRRPPPRPGRGKRQAASTQADPRAQSRVTVPQARLDFREFPQRAPQKSKQVIQQEE
jgi:hypothetical protein